MLCLASNAPIIPPLLHAWSYSSRAGLAGGAFPVVRAPMARKTLGGSGGKAPWVYLYPANNFALLSVLPGVRL